MRRSLFLLVIFLTAASLQASTLLSEGFDDITTLAGSGWVRTNNSSPLGVSNWFQGDPNIFLSETGANDSYIAANFLNADFGGDISNWLLTPVITIDNGEVLTFFTKTDVNPSSTPDNLEVRLSTNGASTNVGATATSLGDFASLLFSVNPALTTTGYPSGWTQVTVTLSGLGGPTTGRFALRYVVPNTANNGDYIGIDTLTVTTAGAIPEPSTAVLLLFGGIAGGLMFRRRVLAGSANLK